MARCTVNLSTFWDTLPHQTSTYICSRPTGQRCTGSAAHVSHLPGRSECRSAGPRRHSRPQCTWRPCHTPGRRLRSAQMRQASSHWLSASQRSRWQCVPITVRKHCPWRIHHKTEAEQRAGALTAQRGHGPNVHCVRYKPLHTCAVEGFSDIHSMSLTWNDTVASGYVTPRKSARGPSRAIVCRQHARALGKPCPGCSTAVFKSLIAGPVWVMVRNEQLQRSALALIAQARCCGKCELELMSAVRCCEWVQCSRLRQRHIAVMRVRILPAAAGSGPCPAAARPRPRPRRRCLLHGCGTVSVLRRTSERSLHAAVNLGFSSTWMVSEQATVNSGELHPFITRTHQRRSPSGPDAALPKEQAPGHLSWQWRGGRRLPVTPAWPSWCSIDRSTAGWHSAAHRAALRAASVDKVRWLVEKLESQGRADGADRGGGLPDFVRACQEPTNMAAGVVIAGVVTHDARGRDRQQNVLM